MTYVVLDWVDISDRDLRELVEVMRRLTQYFTCVRFTDLIKATSWHQQKLSRVLKRGVGMGIIAKCGDGGYTLMPVGGLTTRTTITEERITLSVVKVTSSYIVMRHSVSVALQNTGHMDVNGIYIRVYGDIDWDEPLRLKYNNVQAVERLRRDKCPFNMCDLIFKLDKPVAPGDVIKYGYSFNLYYHPGRDYFSLDVLVGIRDVLIKIPRRYGENVRISVDQNEVKLTGYGFVKVDVSKRYSTVRGTQLVPPGNLQIPLQIEL